MMAVEDVAVATGGRVPGPLFAPHRARVSDTGLLRKIEALLGQFVEVERQVDAARAAQDGDAEDALWCDHDEVRGEIVDCLFEVQQRGLLARLTSGLEGGVK